MDYINRATGATKESVGHAIGNERMESEGHAQKAQAIGEQHIKSTKQSAEHATEQGKSAMSQAGDKAKHVGGDVKERVGEACGSQQMASEGRTDQTEASAKEMAHSAQKDIHGNLK
ncbi:hypothetical protein GGI20_000228 [Coemansia sp. BCRC 34301]|nr:hypothetical protein GGI20_000228 [Coemansia sp. BCRC 34301]